MRTLPRLLLLLLLVVMTMVLLSTRCGIHLGEPPDFRKRDVLSIQIPHKDYYLELLKKTLDTHKLEVEALKRQIAQLQTQLKERGDLRTDDEDSMQRANCCSKAQFYDQFYQQKHCDPALPWEQYRGCIRSKALNEASHPQLGMLAFKEEVDAHKHLVKQRQ